MSEPSQESGRRDLQHFLKLASLQLQSRLKKIEAKDAANSSGRLLLLNELIKEQMTDENRGTSTRSTR